MNAVTLAPAIERKPGVILTGASGGIGEAIAIALAAQGYPLLLVGRNAHRLEQLRVSLQQKRQGLAVTTLVADITLATDRERLYDIASKQSDWSILVNNAGVSGFHSFASQDAADVAQIINTNLLSPILLAQQMLPLLLKRPDAQIINIGSVFGDIGYPGFASYCASKFGLRGFTQALRRELSDTGVRVRWFAPRATQTSLNTPAVVSMNTALKTQADTPEQVAQWFVAFLEGNRAEQVIGWPERLFVFINRLRHSITDNAIAKQLDIIRQYMPR